MSSSDSSDSDSDQEIRSFFGFRPGGGNKNIDDDEQTEDSSRISAKPMRYRGMAFAASSNTPSNPLADLNRTTTSAATSRQSPNPQLFTQSAEQPDESPSSEQESSKAANGPTRPSFLAARQRTQPSGSLASYGKGGAMFARMGYVEGRGLGVDGRGILNPIEQKLRAGRLGLGGMKEKTKQSIDEAKRRGEKVEESEEEEQSISGNKATKKIKREMYQARPRVSYRTVEEIEASGLVVPSVWKNVIDMTGSRSQIIEDMSDFKSINVPDTQEADRSRKAELARIQLEHYVDEWESLQTRTKWVDAEIIRVTSEADEETEYIERLSRVMEIANELKALSSPKPDFDANVVLHLISNKLDSLQFEFPLEAERFRLDDIAIAALLPIFQKLFAEWDPLSNPTYLKDYFVRWQVLLRVHANDRKDDSEDAIADDIYLHHKRHLASKNRASLYESMMASVWLPRVRQALLNDWDVHDPAPIVLLLEEWNGVLPRFLEIQMLEQIILPRLRAAVQEWNPRRKGSTVAQPHMWIFPWMPFLRNHLDSLISDMRHKFGSIMRNWDVRKGVIEGLSAWKEVFGRDLESLLNRHIYPKLVGLLIAEFEVNPADQDMEPLLAVFKWRRVFRSRIFSSLIVQEFFPKWNGILFLWLTSSPDFDEVDQWYKFWKKQFPKELLTNPDIESAFSRGLALINEAAVLGSRAADELQPIADIRPRSPAREHLHRSKQPDKKHAREKPTQTRDQREALPIESTYRDVVEDFCLDNNLLFIPLRKAHDLLGHPLYRITAAASGKGGFVCYFEHEIMWAKVRGNITEEQLEWEPMDFEDIEEWAQFR
ncbi:GC-rich sequence DNA-binding factor-like protein-domain-containing protein [Kockiozyma suomiensis]|uniref:GC-rich sequence DNA-binding factor-like protein-domain-containing protein n=1 Tax=Kockiozyma suomiensis TaxID=1337062 RepID=UPI0033435949